MSARVLALLMASLLLAGAVRAANTQSQPLDARDLQAGDRFGATLAIGKDVIAVGAHLSDRNGKDSGAVYLFQKKPEGWQRQGEPIRGEAGDQLGFDLAMDSPKESGVQTLLVGAPFARGSNGARCGMALRIELAGATVRSRTRIDPPAGCVEGDEFGSSVAVEKSSEKSILAVGSRGADRRAGRVYASFDGGPMQRLEAPDLREGNELGTSLATDGKRLAAGAPFADVPRQDSGAVYVFEGPGAAGVRLLPRDRQALAAFGYSVALQGALLVVGAPLEDRAGTDTGAVHRFDGSAETVISGEKAGDQLGVSVALGEAGLFAGARRAGAQRSGAVYTPSGDGSLGTPIPSPRPQNGAEFGFAVATRGTLLAVGAFLEDAPQEDSGAAYVFEAQQVTVAFATSESCALESERVPLHVIVTTSDGKPTSAPTVVHLQICPPSVACTAMASDLGPFTVDPIPQGTLPNTPQLLAVIPILADGLPETAERLTVRLVPDFPATRGSAADHTMILHDSPLEVTVDGSPLALPTTTRVSTPEGGGVDIGVQLSCPATKEVKVSLSSSNTTTGTLDRTLLRFPVSSVQETMTVRLTGVDDSVCGVCDGTQLYQVELRSASMDTRFNARLEIPAETADDERACLWLSKTVCAYADNTVVYTIEIFNAGPQPVVAHLEDTLPAAVSVVTASADSGVATVDYLENSVVWNGLVPVGRNVVVTLVAGLDALPPGTEVSNTATLSWVRDDQGTVATLATTAVFRSGDLGCPPVPP